MRVVLDTNVWVSGLILPKSAPGEVVAAVREGVVQPVASWELAEELVEVMRRPRIARYGISENDVEDILVVLAPFLPSIEVEPELRDPDDVHVVAAAIAGQAEAIVTGDRDLLDDEQLRLWLEARRVRVLTPRELLSRLQAPSP